MFALERLKEDGRLKKSQLFLVGQQVKPNQIDKGLTVAVGSCAAGVVKSDVQIDRCPPSAGMIYRCIV